jgi:chromate transporter
MTGVSWQLGRTAIIGPLTAAISAVTLVLLWRTKLNSAWLIAAGALIGLAHALLT